MRWLIPRHLIRTAYGIAICVCFFGAPVPAHAEGYTLKIGFILSLSGTWAEFGEAQAHAIEMATEKEPALSSRLKFFVEDCRYGGKDAVAAFNKLRTVDNVDLIFVWGVEPALAVAPIAESTKFPLIVSAVDSSTARGRRYVIRTINYAEQHAQTILKYFRTVGIKKLALIKSQLSFYNILVEGLQRNLRPEESLEILDDVLPSETDFKSIVTKTRHRSFDVMGVFLSPPQILNFFREAEAQNLTLETFGASPFQSRTLLRQAEGKLEGALYVHNDVSQEFEAAYSKRTGSDIQIPWAANMYDFVMLAGELLTHFESKPSPEEILSRFSFSGRRQGAGGAFRYVDSPVEGKYFEYPIVVRQIRGNDFHLVFTNTSF